MEKKKENELRDPDVDTEARMEDFFLEIITDLFFGLDVETAEILNAIIGKLGKFFKSDRAYIFKYKKDKNLAENINEWCKDGIEPQIENLKNIDVSNSLPWFAEKMANNYLFIVEDTMGLPEEASKDREHFVEQDIKSLLVVPLQTRGELFGFFGFDWVAGKHIVTQKEIIIARLASGILGIYIDSFQREQELIKSKKSLQKSYETIENITKTISDVLWSYRVNEKGEVLETSITGQSDKFLGLAPGTIGNDPEKFFAYIHPGDIKRVRGSLDAGLKTPGKSDEVEYRIFLRDGTIKWAVSRGVSTLLPDGTVEVRGITSDITALKKKQEDLRLQKEETEKLNSIMSDREMRIIEMKQEVNALLAELGKEQKYGV